MLQELVIQNIALIENVTISFEAGFNVMCGETGAGKSIIVDSVDLIVGARSDRELIKHGQEKGSVEALFYIDDPSFLQDIPLEENQIILSREVSAAGRNVCRINGKIVTLLELREVAGKLIQICGQNNQQELLNESTHLTMLDQYGDQNIASALREVSGLYSQYETVRKQLKEMVTNEAERTRMLDMLAFQIKEIESANLKDGEEEALTKQKQLMQHAEKIAVSLNSAKGSLKENGAALDCLSQAMHALQAIQTMDERFAHMLETLQEAYYNVEEITFDLSSLSDEAVFEPEMLDQIENRLSEIYALKRKYGGSIIEVLAFLEDAQKKHRALLEHEENFEALQAKLSSCEANLQIACQRLSEIRKKVAHQFENDLVQELVELGMQYAKFEVRFTQKPYSANGLDEVKFFITVNKGQPLRSLSKVASGGEMSRIMLGIKNIIADKDQIGTLIFDEIDTGISGKMANVVAGRIANIAKNHQVICVTHLPQIAAMGDTLRYIEKIEDGGSVKTIVKELDEQQTIKEVARLTGGSDSALALAHAKELLQTAKEIKNSL